MKNRRFHTSRCWRCSEEQNANRFSGIVHYQKGVDLGALFEDQEGLM